jgi:hypothetical protein
VSVAVPASKKKKASSKAAPSGVIDINLDDVEVRDAYDGEDPRPSFYTFELVDVVEHTAQNGNEGIRWIFVLRDNPLYDGWTRFVHSNLDKDSTRWKTEEILLALKGGKAVQGTKQAQVRLDLSDRKQVEKFLKAAKLVRGRVQRRRDSDDDDPQFEIGKIIALDEAKMAARKAAEAALEDDEDETDEFEDAEEFEDADDADEEDDEDSEEDEEEDDESEDEDDEESDSDEDDEEEDVEDDEEEDEEEEPEPPKKTKKAAASKPASKKAASNVTPISDAKKKKPKKK